MRAISLSRSVINAIIPWAWNRGRRGQIEESHPFKTKNNRRENAKTSHGSNYSEKIPERNSPSLKFTNPLKLLLNFKQGVRGEEKEET